MSRRLGAAALLAVGIACRSAPSAPPVARHLVVVTVDTLRADRVGAYGGPGGLTPNLDRIAREGAMAIEAMAHVPLTRPSHVNLFTGLLPTETGVRDNISPAVVPDTPLLAEVLKGAGFATGAFVSSVVLEPASGLARGFDAYSARFAGGGGEARFLSTVQKKGDVTTEEAIAWLRRQEAAGDRRLFAWLHLYDPHDPYEPPEPYASRYAETPYEGEVAFADELVGRLDAALARLGLREHTLLLVTSDHGEGLGEHDEALHGFFAYQSTLRIPLLVRGPGIAAGRRLAPTVRLVDVMPTLLDLLAVRAPAGFRTAGVSLAEALRGEAPGREPVTYAESLVPLLHFGWSDLRVVREGRWKYIQAPRPELYDLQRDPGESRNLAPDEPVRVRAMRQALGAWLDREREVGRSSASVPADLVEKLGALGYVGGTAPADTATPGADPKDKLEEFRFANAAIRDGLLRLHAKDHEASAARFQAVLRRGIASFEVHFYLARALLGARRAGEAAAHFEEAVRRAPAHAPAWEGLAQARAARGEIDAALEALRRGQAALPREGALRLAQARLLRGRGRLAEARTAYEAALPLLPRDARLRVQLGELLRDLGSADEAIGRLREAVEIDPAAAGAWNSLGMTLGGAGRFAEAEECFREALRLDATDHRHAYNLGLALARQGKAAEARPFFEQALALSPAFTPAREELAQARQRSRD